MNNLRLSVLDFGYFMPPEIQAVDTLNFTFDFVKTLEKLGFHRYWMAEHYNDYCSWTNPEILLAMIAGNTDRIRVGAAGIAMFYHNPYRVATSFKMIAALFPNRIDLGIARGGIPPHIQELLTGKKDISQKEFKENIPDLLNFFSKEFTYEESSQYIPLPPYGSALPTPWLLGTSIDSARESIKLTTKFSLSTFHIKKPLSYYKEIIKIYKEEYFNLHNIIPEFNVAVSCTCILNDKDLNMFISESKSNMALANGMNIIGNSNYCAEKIFELYSALSTDEIVLYDPNKNLNQRIEGITSLGLNLIKP